jgi:hypothetical protein
MNDGKQRSDPNDRPGADAARGGDQWIELGPLVDLGIGLLTGMGVLTAALQDVSRELELFRQELRDVKHETNGSPLGTRGAVETYVNGIKVE